MKRSVIPRGACNVPPLFAPQNGNQDDVPERRPPALGLQRLTDIPLTSDRDGEWRPNGSVTVVYTFSAVALFVLTPWLRRLMGDVR